MCASHLGSAVGKKTLWNRWTDALHQTFNKPFPFNEGLCWNCYWQDCTFFHNQLPGEFHFPLHKVFVVLGFWQCALQTNTELCGQPVPVYHTNRHIMPVSLHKAHLNAHDLSQICEHSYHNDYLEEEQSCLLESKCETSSDISGCMRAASAVAHAGLVGHFVQTWPDSECSHTVQFFDCSVWIDVASIITCYGTVWPFWCWCAVKLWYHHHHHRQTFRLPPSGLVHWLMRSRSPHDRAGHMTMVTSWMMLLTPPSIQLFPILESTEKLNRKTCTDWAEIHNHCYPRDFTGPKHDVAISVAGQQLVFPQQMEKRQLSHFGC